MNIVVDNPQDRDIDALREEFRACIETGNAARLRELLEWFVYGNSLREVMKHPVRIAPRSPVVLPDPSAPSPANTPEDLQTDPDWLL